MQTFIKQDQIQVRLGRTSLGVTHFEVYNKGDVRILNSRQEEDEIATLTGWASGDVHTSIALMDELMHLNDKY